jgi:site-specific recombinase XerD
MHTLWIQKEGYMRQLNSHTIPTIIKSKQGWYIQFYTTHNDIRQKIRLKLGLNRIKDLTERQKCADNLISLISNKLQHTTITDIDAFTDDIIRSASNKLQSIADALLYALSLKIKETAVLTHKNYKHTVHAFIAYLKKEKLDHLSVDNLTKLVVLDYLDKETLRGVSRHGWNKRVNILRTMCSVLEEREIIAKNPFKGFKKKKEERKRRRAFNDREKEIIFREILKTDKWLALLTLFQYYCAIRPRAEMNRLRFHDIDLKRGLIFLSGEQTKNGEKDIVTIPDDCLDIIKTLDIDFERYPKSFLIFGRHLEPHPTLCVGYNTYHAKHQAVLQKLKDDGVLNDIEGMTSYSWKDTGVQFLIQSGMNVYDIMRHLRHRSLEHTQRYCDSIYKVSLKIKHLDNKLVRNTEGVGV